jgi:hypothetical protein
MSPTLGMSAANPVVPPGPLDCTKKPTLAGVGLIGTIIVENAARPLRA